MNLARFGYASITLFIPSTCKRLVWVVTNRYANILKHILAKSNVIYRKHSIHRFRFGFVSVFENVCKAIDVGYDKQEIKKGIGTCLM